MLLSFFPLAAALHYSEDVLLGNPVGKTDKGSVLVEAGGGQVHGDYSFSLS